LVVHKGFPEQGFDLGDVGGVLGENGWFQDVLDGNYEVFLIVVVRAGCNFSLTLGFFVREFKNVDKITFDWLPGPEGTGLPRSLGGRLAQGLEL
jgi:hypothetical protein